MEAATLPGIRQSDASTFRRCRTLWDWTSSLRGNLQPAGEPVAALWLGTGGHFALEDYHGYNYFGDPRVALRAYAHAHLPAERPSNWEELIILGEAMLEYYVEQWLPRRDTMQTLWIDGKPQVEVNWTLPLPGVAAVKTGTFDRIVTDEYGRLWVLDYKFNRAIDTGKLDTDAQITTYLWAAAQLYGKMEGMAYLQLAKVVARQPETIKKGEEFSQAKSAPVTYSTYARVLMQKFGGIPERYVAHINWLASQEDAEGDLLIRRSRVRRNATHIANQDWYIKAQAQEMVYPHVAIYPNPTRDCSYCSFKVPCVAKMEGNDYQAILDAEYISRNVPLAWKERLVYPEPQEASV